MLGGNRETVEAFQKGLGQIITGLTLVKDHTTEEDHLLIEFESGYKMRIFDDGQSCCESRWMHTDDDLAYHVGATLLNGEVRDGPEEQEGEYGECKESQFLILTTSKGQFTMVNYNEHNGYYGGFGVVVREVPDA